MVHGSTFSRCGLTEHIRHQNISNIMKIKKKVENVSLIIQKSVRKCHFPRKNCISEKTTKRITSSCDEVPFSTERRKRTA
jgi:hypothetical protein